MHWVLGKSIQTRNVDALRTPKAIQSRIWWGTSSLALCRLLLQQPDVLLLDEPTNHLDAESVLWLEQHLAQYAGTVIAVTHGTDNVAGWILELDRRRYSLEGKFVLVGSKSSMAHKKK
jgi:ATPase subunit of ABC transporter with duplicated ATPase domains